MITGVNPDVHGIWANKMFSPSDQTTTQNWFFFDVKAPTITQMTKDAGMIVAGVSWPVSVGGPYHMNIPHAFPKNVAEAKFLYSSLKGPINNDIVSNYTFADQLTDLIRRDITINFMNNGRTVPQLFTIHFTGVDEVQHTDGKWARKAIENLEVIDSCIESIIEETKQRGIYESSYFIVVSDHGFANVTWETNPAVLLVRNGLYFPNGTWYAYFYDAGGSGAIYINPSIPLDSSQYVSVTSRVNDIVNELLSDPNYGVKRSYNQSELQQLGGFNGAFVALETRPLFMFGNQISEPIIREAKVKGTHGWCPTNSEMFASFLIRGPHIAVGKIIEPIRLIDIAPTIAHIFNLQFPSNVQGRVLSEIFV
jgi:predicted AlkP superfamily pyrophosphatase or phosphodiesterase